MSLLEFNNVLHMLNNCHVSRNIFLGVFLILLMGFIYWLFYVPCNWTKSIDDVGYDLPTVTKKTISTKKETINRIRRLRKVGANELPPPFPNGWYAVSESKNVRKGQAINVSCLGEQFVVYRTNNNLVNVLDAYCPHMGANMGIGGHVIGENIQCPFHQWTFRGDDGQCVGVPYAKYGSTTSKTRKWISCEANGFIFIWYHMENDVEPWDLPIVKEIQNKNFVYHGRNEFTVNCHIQEIPENGADLAHFKAVHNASLLAGTVDPNSSVLANTGTHHWKAVWQSVGGTKKHLATINLEHFIKLTPKYKTFKMDVVGQQIGPAYVQLHMKSPTFGRIVVLQTITPIEPLVQKVIHRFYAPRILSPVMKFIVFGESIMFERDMHIWNHKIFRSRPQLVKEDYAIKGFRNWYSQFYSTHSKSFIEAREDLNW